MKGPSFPLLQYASQIGHAQRCGFLNKDVAFTQLLTGLVTQAPLACTCTLPCSLQIEHSIPSIQDKFSSRHCHTSSCFYNLIAGTFGGGGCCAFETPSESPMG